MADMTAMELAQTLDQAVAAYRRYYGRERAMDKLRHMVRAMEEAERLARSEEAQRRAAE